MKKSTVIILVAFAVVGGVLWSSQTISTRSQAPDGSSDTVDTKGIKGDLPADTVTTTAPLKLGPNSLYVPTQRPGSIVIANLISIDVPGYVAIHESVDGRLGAIIGVSKLLPRGVHKEVTATLSRSVADGEELIAVLYREKSGTGFNSGDDSPIRDADENIMYMNFIVSADALDPSNAEMI